MALDFDELVEMSGADRSALAERRNTENTQLKTEIAETEKASSKLKENNAEKIASRTAIRKKISIRKSGGGWLIFLAIAGVVAAWFAFKEEPMKLWQTLSFVGAGMLFALGIVVRFSHRKYRASLQEADIGLSEYDREQAQYDEKIRNCEAKIEKNQADLDVISEYEKDMEFYRLQYSLRSGHVIIAATGEFHAFADDPSKPSEGRSYKSDIYYVKNLEVYVDGRPCGTGETAYFAQQSCRLSHVQLDPGAREIMIRVAYGIGDSITNEQTIGPMQIPANASMFGWAHVSGCGKYTNIYKKSYNSLDEFCKGLNIAHYEIKNKL